MLSLDLWSCSCWPLVGLILSAIITGQWNFKFMF